MIVDREPSLPIWTWSKMGHESVQNYANARIGDAPSTLYNDPHSAPPGDHRELRIPKLGTLVRRLAALDCVTAVGSHVDGQFG